LRRKIRWMNVELSKRDKDTANKKEGRELKNPDITGSIRRVRQREFRSTWEREKNNGTRREKTGIGWKESKEGAECVMRRQRQ
jgi:hypothetical protein